MTSVEQNAESEGWLVVECWIGLPNSEERVVFDISEEEGRRLRDALTAVLP
jgi:hypothetical protein